MRALHVFPTFTLGVMDEEASYALDLTDLLRRLGVKVNVLNGTSASLPFLAKTWSAMARCHVILAGFLPGTPLSAIARMARARGKPLVVLPAAGSISLPDRTAAVLAMNEESAAELTRTFPHLRVVSPGKGIESARRVRDLYESLGARCAIPQG
jgi:hypothetical protein